MTELEQEEEFQVKSSYFSLNLQPRIPHPVPMMRLNWALTYHKDRSSSTSSAALQRTRERLRRQRQAYNDVFFFGRRIRSGPHRAR